MDPSDRQKIQKNIIPLSRQINLEVLYSELVRRDIIGHEDVERIKSKFPTVSEQGQEFFLYYTRRGPDAYSILVESLVATGHISEALLLRQTSRPSTPSSLSSSSYTFNTPENVTGNDDIMVSSITSFTSLPSPTVGTSEDKILGGVVPLDSSVSSFIFERPRLQVIVKRATIYNAGITNMVYPMMSSPRGFALLINNINFPGDPKSTRNGADNDSANLQQLLEAFGFIITIRRDVKKKNLLDPERGIIKLFVDQFNSTNVDACFVALMSHGSKHLLRTSDPINPNDVNDNHAKIHEDILQKFNNRYCPSLMGKPKIFVIQACRGKTHDRGVRRTQTDGKNLSDQIPAAVPALPDKCPEMEDFLVCNSTSYGYVSNRDTDRGSWYIECLCEVFMNQAYNTEILVMLKEVARRMRHVESEHGEKQMCSFDNTGFYNDLYFNPGLYAENDTNGHEDS